MYVAASLPQMPAKCPVLAAIPLFTGGKIAWNEEKNPVRCLGIVPVVNALQLTDFMTICGETALQQLKPCPCFQAQV
jgi:hypothetical protein